MLLFLAGLIGCGGGSMVTPPPPPPPPPTISATVAVNSATSGPFDLAMSTSFQPAEWDYTFLQQFPGALAPLGALNPSHIRLQGISQGVPQASPSTWDFTVLDGITHPVLAVGDHSPEFQVAKGPDFMYTNNDASSYNDSFLDSSYSQFAAYAADLVRYYDTGGFTSLDNVSHVSPAYPNDKVTWWGIYNEPSINNFTSNTSLTPALDYTKMYNAVVPAMHAVDQNIKFVGLEMCCGSESWASTFGSNVTAQVDAVATHYYSICDQSKNDGFVFSTVPGFASSVQTIRSNLSANPNLATVPIWITENNVNADFDTGNGMSACNPGRRLWTTCAAPTRFLRRGGRMCFRKWVRPACNCSTTGISRPTRSLGN